MASCPESDEHPTSVKPVKPLIEGSARPWTFKPPPSTLDSVDPAPFLAMHHSVQAHLRKTHLLLDCAQTRLVTRMAEVEALGARTIQAFTSRVAEQNREMKQIGMLAEELAVQTKTAFNILSKLIDLTLRVKRSLTPHDQAQLDHGSALYRSGKPGSKASMALLMQLGSPKGNNNGNSNNSGTGGGEGMASPSLEKGSHTFWMEKALPKWKEVSAKEKVKAARRGGGIPTSIRGQVWIQAIGNALQLTDEQFQEASAAREGVETDEAIALIRHDVPRTFHRLELFVNPQETFTIDLVRVLEGFARAKGSPGYVQGMSYLAGLLLLNMSPFDAWVCLSNLIRTSHMFLSIFKMNVGGIVQHARIFEMVLSEEMGDVYARLHDFKITSDHYLLDWWMTLFCRKLPLRLVARIWDLFLLGGEIELHKAAVALVRLHREAILQAPDFDEAFRVLTTPVDAVDEHEFLSGMAAVRVGPVWANVLAKLETEQA